MSLELWDDDDDDEDYAYPEQDEEPIDLGPCCACGKEDQSVRNIAALNFQAPMDGTGWGCFQCGLPSNGALAIVCDACFEGASIPKDLKHLINGLPGEKGRVDIGAIERVPFEHDMSKHSEAQPFRMPTDYMPPHNTPLYWRDEVTGVLPAAMMAYISYSAEPETKPAPTAEQLALVIAYLRYVINAPCWIDETGTLTRLRKQAASLTTVDDVNWWLVDCLEIGLNPL